MNLNTPTTVTADLFPVLPGLPERDSSPDSQVVDQSTKGVQASVEAVAAAFSFSSEAGLLFANSFTRNRVRQNLLNDLQTNGKLDEAWERCIAEVAEDALYSNREEDLKECVQLLLGARTPEAIVFLKKCCHLLQTDSLYNRMDKEIYRSALRALGGLDEQGKPLKSIPSGERESDLCKTGAWEYLVDARFGAEQLPEDECEEIVARERAERTCMRVGLQSFRNHFNFPDYYQLVYRNRPEKLTRSDVQTLSQHLWEKLAGLRNKNQHILRTPQQLAALRTNGNTAVFNEFASLNHLYEEVLYRHNQALAALPAE